jgi:hypothetical protein
MMQKRQQKFFSMMQSNNEELTSLVQKMEATNDEDQKVEVMETLLAQLVEDRTEIHQQMMGNRQMMGMMPMMMQHMYQHMQMAENSDDASMMNCPMMSGHSQHSEGSGMMHDQGHQH